MDDPESGPPADEPAPAAVDESRRRFLTIAALGGTAAAISAIAAGYLTGLFRIGGGSTRPPWEIAPGVVDYDKVPGPGEVQGPVTLRVAQWFDYWPGTFLANSDWSFTNFMKQQYDVDVSIQVDYFTSMEELFLWISPLQKKEYDVFVPSNEMAALFDRAGWLYNLNEEWIPNAVHLEPTLLGVPADDPWDRRPDGSRRAMPYFWGTTGVGVRTDTFDPLDAEDLGWEIFLQPSYQGEDLRGRMNMLDEMRDVLLVGFKMAGWESQIDQGLTPSGDLPPNGIQWTSNETDPSKVAAARDWLFRARSNLFGYNSTNVIPSLQTGAAVANHAWSGDAILAASPDAASPWPVEYIIPKQGTRWWIDAMSIHSQARNLWVAHEFLNYIHRPDIMKNLTVWNRYSTTNKTTRSLLEPLGASQWDMANDPRLYPDASTFRRLDLALDVGLTALEDLYNPLWNELRFGV